MINKIARYLQAIDNGSTAKYWDLQNAYKGRMKWKAFYRKWRSKKL